MNKKAKQKAFFVCVAIFVMYVMVGLGFTEKLGGERVSAAPGIAPKDMAVATPKLALKEELRQPVGAVTAVPVPPKADPAPEPAPVASEPVQVKKAEKPEPPRPEPLPAPVKPAPVKKEILLAPPAAFVRDGAEAEPSFFIAVPIVCHAISHGLIEKEGLIFIKKDGYNNPSWKKPLDILKDKDEEGLKSISKAIGKKQILNLLESEGITHVQDGDSGTIILGKGYAVERKRLLALYDKHVPADCPGVLPFVVEGVGVTKGGRGFEFVRARDALKERPEKDGEEWMMPNLTNLTVRDAIDKLSGKTSKIKVFGSGMVTDQQPRPFQKIMGETECIIYGRTSKQ